MTALVLASFLAGLVLLSAGGELLVRGSSRLASAAGVSPLVIGLTVVAFGTSTPELAVCLRAALVEQPDIALGNVIGSNISNVLLVLGLCALLAPLSVDQRLIRVEVPLMVGVSAAPLALAFDGRLGRSDGLIMVAGLAVYVVLAIRMSRKENRSVSNASERKYGPPVRERQGARVARNIALALAGLGLLVVGARWLVAGAVAIARGLGIGELVIGLTVVAVGTSLPEIAVSLVATLRGERDIAVGNIVGSNLYNLLGILGATAAIAPAGLPVPARAFLFDMPLMIAVAVLCMPLFFTGAIISRWEGLLFLGYYSAYVAWLFLGAVEHEALEAFQSAMLYVVLPLTVLTLVASFLHSVRAGRAGTAGRE